MSVWSTKASNVKRDYILFKHTLPNINTVLNGVKFRASYAVVEKNSKTHNSLKKLPLLRNALEYPLINLRGLKFITKTSDIKLIYGQDVYVHFLAILEKTTTEEIKEAKEEKEQLHIESGNKCHFRTVLGELCKEEILEISPSKHCKRHILQDPKLESLGFEIPLAMTKEQRQNFKEKTINKLEKLKKEGKF